MLQSNWLKILFGTALICVLAPLALPLEGYVAITLQSLAVVLVPMIFGWRNGVISIALYLLLGGFGLPVFADFSAGWDKFIGRTGGFLFGFLPAGFVAGYLAERTKVQYARYFFIFIAAQIVLLIFGTIGLAAHGYTFADIFKTAKLLFPGLMMKSFIGGILVLAVKINHDSTN